MNKCILLGRLGKDPELTHTPAGNTVCKMTLATSEKFKDKQGDKQERTEWHRIIVWGRLAEVCNEYLKKGSQVLFQGKIATRSWDKDGQKQYTTEIIATEMQMLDSKQREQEPKNDTYKNERDELLESIGKQTKHKPSNQDPFTDGDIPF